ncbi:MAG: hypothetical protein ACOYNS_03320 [Bacteroidota bacterium]
MKKLLTLFVLCIAFSSCEKLVEETEESVNYSMLAMQPDRDSIFINANNETWTVTLIGTVLNTSERTLSNSGLMTDARFTVTTVDTSYEVVDVKKALWISSNSSVASVSNGVITGKSPGYASITAKIGNTVTDPLNVNVRAVNTAPGLSLDPPPAILIFENFTTVSGTVQSLSKLSVREPQSGFYNAAVPYSASGAFNTTVTGLNQGIRTITVSAANSADTTKFSERTKIVAYYQPNTPGANTIVGNWLGTTLLTTLKKQFNFSIANSIIPTRYDITGKLDIQFEGVGLVQDIDLIGVLNSNGTISASLTKSYQGFTINGKFSGYFKTDGTGQGDYSAQATKSGWPKISFSDKWTAVKLP